MIGFRKKMKKTVNYTFWKLQTRSDSQMIPQTKT